MSSVATAGGGGATAPVDVVKVPAPPGPPIPTPTPNIAMFMNALPPTCTLIVAVAGMPALTKSSQVMPSMGDEVGVLGGLTSGTIVGACTFLMGAARVVFEGSPVIVQTASTSHNTNNAPMGLHDVPSQPFVVASPF